MTTGSRRSIARSMARVIFSPTTTPMLPPMKRVLHRRDDARRCRRCARWRQITASFMPVAAMLASRRLRYGLVSVNCSGSVDVQAGVVLRSSPPSNSIRSRSAAPRRK